MDGWLKLCGAALLCVVSIVVIRQLHRDGALPLQWLGVLLFGVAVLGMMQPLVSFALELVGTSALGEVAALLLRGLGVAYLTQLCADVCRQSGEAQIAAGVENAGRVQLLLLALPTLQQLVETAGQLLQSL